MDKYLFIEMLKNVKDPSEFKNIIEASNLAVSDIMTEVSLCLTKKFLSDNKYTTTQALYNLLHPQKKYILYVYILDSNGEIQMIGTKEEILNYITNDTYSRICQSRDSTPEFQNVKKETVYSHYESKFTENHHNGEPIEYYDSVLTNAVFSYDYYQVFDMDYVNELSNKNKAQQ